jgi:hypothetical protein
MKKLCHLGIPLPGNGRSGADINRHNGSGGAFEATESVAEED